MILNAMVLKVTEGQKSLDLLLGKQRQTLDKHDIGFKK